MKQTDEMTGRRILQLLWNCAGLASNTDQGPRNA